jgi:hypothetical protein
MNINRIDILGILIFNIFLDTICLELYINQLVYKIEGGQ